MIGLGRRTVIPPGYLDTQNLVSKTTFDKKTSGVIYVEDFNPVGDGVTDDQTVIVNAVSDAYNKNMALMWGDKTYLTTANIPYFHDVKHLGEGVIKRGSDLFFITPSSANTNIIYTGLGGTSVNDGLSSSQPRSLSYVRNVLQNLGDKASNGQWRIQFVAGTITDTGLVFNNLPYFSKPLQIWGVWDGVNRLAVWDGTASAAVYAFRSDANNAVLNIEFKDLKFINWNKDPSNAGAIVCWGGAGVHIKTENIEVKDSTIGVWMRSGFSRHYGDVMDNCVWGYTMQYSHSATIGNSTQRVTIKNCDKGVFCARQSVTHVDYTDFTNNIVDIQVHQKSRVATVGSTFATWTDVSIWLQGDSIHEDSTDTVSTWNATSITDAKPIYRFDNGSSVPSVHTGALPYRESHFAPASGYTLTGTTVETLLTSQVGFGSPLRMPKNMLYNNGTLQIKIEAKIDVGGSGGTKKVRLSGAGSSAAYELAFIDIPSGGGLGMLTFDLTFRSDGSVLIRSEYQSSNATLNTLKFNSVTATTMDASLRDKTATQSLWRIYASLVNVADSLSIFSLTTTIVG